jgi:hypothetical protein
VFELAAVVADPVVLAGLDRCVRRRGGHRRQSVPLLVRLLDVVDDGSGPPPLVLLGLEHVDNGLFVLAVGHGQHLVGELHFQSNVGHLFESKKKKHSVIIKHYQFPCAT